MKCMILDEKSKMRNRFPAALRLKDGSPYPLERAALLGSSSYSARLVCQMKVRKRSTKPQVGREALSLSVNLKFLLYSTCVYGRR